ncbi:MAG TPA: CHRD domain-containing protein [Solirubrobacterales bacterium]|nr:CHRD domain-containing protein [Solirubrobacterales bacterium]
MKKLLLAAVLALAAVAMVVTVATAKNGNGHRGNGGFHAKLDGYQEVPEAISTAARGKLKVKVSGETVQYRLRYSGFTGAVNAAHIHFGRPAVTGGVIAFLCGGGDKPACPANAGEVSGTIDAADVLGPADQGIDPGEFDEFVAALKAGATYANVHTPQYETGEIRGHIGKGKFGGFGFGRGHDKDRD